MNARFGPRLLRRHRPVAENRPGSHRAAPPANENSTALSDEIAFPYNRRSNLLRSSRWLALADECSLVVRLTTTAPHRTPRHGQKFRPLAIETIGVPEVISTSERMTFRKDISSLREVEDKTIGYPPNSTAQYALDAAIGVYRLDRSKIKPVPLAPSEIVAAWKGGDIDGAYAWDPASQQLVANGGLKIFPQ